MIWRNFFSAREKFSFFHSVVYSQSLEVAETQCGKTRNSLSLKKLSSNQLFSNFFSKTIAFTKFLRKKCEREFLQFPHCVKVNFRDFQTVEKYLRTYTCTTSKVSFSVKSIFSTLTSRNISNKSKYVTRFHEFFLDFFTKSFPQFLFVQNLSHSNLMSLQ